MSISFDELQQIDKTLIRVNNIIRKRYDNHVFHADINCNSGVVKAGETLSLYKPRVKMICLNRVSEAKYIFRLVVIFNQCQSKNLWFLRNTWSIRKPLKSSLKEKFDEDYDVNKLTINQSFIQHILYKHFLEGDYGVSTLGSSPEEFFNSFGSIDDKFIPLYSLLYRGFTSNIDTTIFKEYWDAPSTKFTDVNDVCLQNIFVYNGLRSCYSLGNPVSLNSANIAMDKYVGGEV